MAELVLTRAQARRVAVRAQLLDAHRPAGLLPMVEQLRFLQLDPTAAVAPSADLVAWSRLGARYRPEQLRTALERDRSLFELNAMVYPMADLAMFRPRMRAWPPVGDSRWYGRARDWLAANEPFRRYVLGELERRGPLRSRDLEDRAVVPWASTGWTHNRNVTQLLEFLTARGEVAISGRQGSQRVWDLAERVYPAGVPELDPAAADELVDARRLRSLGIARPAMVGTAAGVPATVTGVPGPWRVQPDVLDGAPFRGRTALLSPFDRLIHDRDRARALFGFEYKLEMYQPAAARRWGYYALPALHGDRLVAKVDARADRKAGVLRLNAIHLEDGVRAGAAAAIGTELRALAGWLGLEFAS